MFSFTRFLIILGIYLAYLFAIIFLFAESDTTLYLILLFVGVGLFLLMMFMGWGTTSGKYKWLMRNGREAEATILEMKDTGVTLNNSPYVRFRLRVTPSAGAPFEVGVRAFVSRVALPRVGEQVRVKYDPDNPKHVIMI
ncbi:MAG: hypothetical protein HDKAJFGB_00415 [Anaerolineae bacterium]|nr:hypothetical protein [Anaerolineae bacterium]